MSSDFERWWDANWKKLVDTCYYLSSEKTMAEHGWNAAKKDFEAELTKLREELAYDKRTIQLHKRLLYLLHIKSCPY